MAVTLGNTTQTKPSVPYRGPHHCCMLHLGHSAALSQATARRIQAWHGIYSADVRGSRMIQVVLAQPRGFCAGVERAIEIVERALAKFGPPIYVRHEIVHNRHVVEDLRKRGAVFVDELDEIPPGAMTVFSAHGVAKRVEELAQERQLPVIDATCPLVAKVHAEGRRYAAQGREIVLVGHAGHAEVEGTIGQTPGKVHLVQTVADVATLDVTDPDRLAYA